MNLQRKHLFWNLESEESKSLKWAVVFVVAKASTFPSCLWFICLLHWRANDLRSTFNASCLPWLFSFFPSLQTWTLRLRPCLPFLSRLKKKKKRLCCLLHCLGIRPIRDLIKLLLIPGHRGLVGKSLCIHQCAVWLEHVSDASTAESSGESGGVKTQPYQPDQVSIHTTDGFEHLLEILNILRMQSSRPGLWPYGGQLLMANKICRQILKPPHTPYFVLA